MSTEPILSSHHEKESSQKWYARSVISPLPYTTRTISAGAQTHRGRETGLGPAHSTSRDDIRIDTTEGSISASIPGAAAAVGL